MPESFWRSWFCCRSIDSCCSIRSCDFWATARYSVQQQKELLQQLQEMLAAELAEHKYRQDNANGTP